MPPSPGPPPIKLLKNALEAGDEEKAIEIYTTVPIDGKSGAAGMIATYYIDFYV